MVFFPKIDCVSTSLFLLCKNKNSLQNAILCLDVIDESSDVAFYPSIRKNRYLEYEAVNGPVMNITTTAATVSKSISMVYDEVDNIKFEGMFFRKDICKPSLVQI